MMGAAPVSAPAEEPSKESQALEHTGKVDIQVDKEGSLVVTEIKHMFKRTGTTEIIESLCDDQLEESMEALAKLPHAQATTPEAILKEDQIPDSVLNREEQQPTATSEENPYATNS